MQQKVKKEKQGFFFT